MGLESVCLVVNERPCWIVGPRAAVVPINLAPPPREAGICAGVAYFAGAVNMVTKREKRVRVCLAKVCAVDPDCLAVEVAFVEKLEVGIWMSLACVGGRPCPSACDAWRPVKAKPRAPEDANGIFVCVPQRLRDVSVDLVVDSKDMSEGVRSSFDSEEPEESGCGFIKAAARREDA